MIDREVTDILEEIRSRVRGTENLPGPLSAEKSNGDRAEPEGETLLTLEIPNKVGYSSLTVLARAWDQLPPLVSKRSGGLERLELWIKSKLKTALRWFTWEQVNFNAATHRTFLELIESLKTYEETLTRIHYQLQSQLKNESAARKELLEAQQREIDTQRADLLTEIQTRRNLNERQQAAFDSQQLELSQQRALLKAQQAELNERLAALKAHENELQSQVNELMLQQSDWTIDLQSQLAQTIEEQDAARQSQLANLVQEFRERDERLLDEQRVCFKQLSLELRESQVLEDRARREVESRLTKLEAPPDSK